MVYHDRNFHLKSSTSPNYDRKQLITVVRNSHPNMFRTKATTKDLTKQKIGLHWNLFLTKNFSFLEFLKEL